MIGFAVLAISIYVVGSITARWLWRKLDGEEALEQTTPFELATAGALLGCSLWLAANWILALTFTLNRWTLLATTGVVVISAAAVLVRHWRDAIWPVTHAKIKPATAIVLVPLGCWLDYILWRGSVLPPDSHDVLSYHLPRAVFIVQAHGYRFFPAADPRINSLPANYELLLADVLLLARSDRLTEWIGAIFYVLFLVATAAVVERWWGRGPHVLASILATAITPVLLLHSGADKNDLMTGDFAVVALLAGARWYARGGAMPWFLLIVALAVGGGTKPHQAAILVGFLPLIALRGGRLLREHRIRFREIGATLAVAAIAFAFGGGATYVLNTLHDRGTPIPFKVGSLHAGSSTVIEYGDWANLWRFPLMLLMAPFSSDPRGVWVPWLHERWFWPKYEIFFSNYGELFTLLVCLLPFCVLLYRSAADESVRRERMAFCTAATIAFMFILPVQFRPLGFFGGFPRYLVFIIPAVVAWTVAPVFRHLSTTVGERAATAPLILLAACFSLEAVDVATYDRFSPLTYALYASEHPGTRVITFQLRAGMVVDGLAGPHDTIAVDAGFDTWMYPAMGAHWTRRLEFIPAGEGKPHIPDDADWVIVDRSWNAIWGNPRLTDLGQYWQYIGKGTPTPDDVRVYDALRTDRRFILAYDDRELNQAVFRRFKPPS